MEEIFILNLQRLTKNPDKKKFLLAVSGGMDSVVLTSLFAHFNLSFDIAHCNFHLRGHDSDEDMLFVKKMATHYKVQFHLAEFDTLALHNSSNLSIEMIARNLRYDWFNSLMENYDFLVTAHHANDNVETQILNLLRGTGLKGLCGIPEHNHHLIRPLLPFSSSDIHNYATSHHLDFRTDLSNLSLDYNRNKVRHTVIPPLLLINEHFLDVSVRNFNILNKQYQFYKDAILLMKSQLVNNQNTTHRISINALLNSSYSELLLYEILSDYNFSPPSIINIYESLKILSTGKFFYSSSHRLLVNRDELLIAPITILSDFTPVTIHSPQEFLSFNLQCQLLSCQDDINFDNSGNTLYLDASKVNFPFVIRKWENGDSFVPFGLKGKKKLSNYFNDIKMDRMKKEEVRVLCKDDEILWVIGYRTSASYSITRNHTNYYYKITYNGNDGK